MKVLVTAGGAGIGEAITRAFAAHGHDVHICDVDAERLTAMTALPNVRGSLADVGRADQVDALIDEAIAWLGHIDVLVNNAGIGGPRAAIEDVTDLDWDRCVAVNLTGSFYTMRRVIPLMKARRSGMIINIVTSSARTGLPNRTPYVVSKVGLIGLTQNAAREVGPFGIRCNAILPGTIDNTRGRALIARFAAEKGLDHAAAQEEYLSHVSMRTLIAPEEVAETALFLAGDGARHISGQLIGVCGNVEWEE